MVCTYIVEPDISRELVIILPKETYRLLRLFLQRFIKLQIIIYLEGTLPSKPNMVTSGTKCEKQADPETAGKLTMMALARHVPPAVPGIFLFGGLSESQSTDYLRAVNKDDSYPRPWQTLICLDELTG